MKYFISIQYGRRYYQIRFSIDTLRFIERSSNIEELHHIEVGLDISKKTLAFKPLSEETEGSYYFVNKSCIRSVELAKIIQGVSKHSGLYRYPLLWHTELKLAVADLAKGLQQ